MLGDIEPIIRNIQSTIDLHYYKMGLMNSQDIPTYSSLLNTPNIGQTLSGDWNRIDDYLVMKKDAILSVRNVPQKAGGVRFAVDQLENPSSITIKIGGIYSEGILVAGRAATASDDETSNELFKLFSTRIKKDFKKIGAFYVSKQAKEKLELGWRLVTNDKSPKEYDLVG